MILLLHVLYIHVCFIMTVGMTYNEYKRNQLVLFLFHYTYIMIISLNTTHADRIVTLLQEHYQVLNTYLGVPYYNTDYDFLHGHIVARLEHQE